MGAAAVRQQHSVIAMLRIACPQVKEEAFALDESDLVQCHCEDFVLREFSFGAAFIVIEHNKCHLSSARCLPKVPGRSRNVSNHHHDGGCCLSSLCSILESGMATEKLLGFP